MHAATIPEADAVMQQPAGHTMTGRVKAYAQPVVIGVLAVALVVTMVFTFAP